MEENIYKEVYFDQYCNTCVNKDSAESSDPCAECLENAVNLYSHKPVNWKAKKQ